MLKNDYLKKGFSLLEMLVVVAIVMALVTIAILNYRFFERGTVLESEARNMETTLKTAQGMTLASVEDSQYGVHFEAGSYTLFKGAVYNIGDPGNKIYQLDSRLEVYDISLAGGGSEIIFNRLTGTVDQAGQISIRIISDPSKTQTVLVSSTGQIQFLGSGAACCDTGRITDSRHIHLDLGWSIESALTLTLNFSDAPSVVENITMSDYFDITPNPTEFDWSGTISVNNEDQILRIHTHTLDSFNTLLCIHRDGDHNSKTLDILIDGKNIITFYADGSAVVGSFGGNATNQ